MQIYFRKANSFFSLYQDLKTIMKEYKTLKIKPSSKKLKPNSLFLFYKIHKKHSILPTQISLDKNKKSSTIN